MVFLHFRVGRDRYVLDAKQVVAVIPLVDIKGIPQTPAALAGVISCRGSIVPVIDLCRLMIDRPAARSLSTRIVLVSYADRRGDERVLGLIAEQVCETVQRDETDFVKSGVDNTGAPYLGPVAEDARGLLQRVQVQSLLSDELRDLLFPEGIC
jgi:chemotaxis-related protein WspB